MSHSSRAQIARPHLARMRQALSTSLKTGLAGQERSTRDPIPTPVLSTAEGPPGRCLTPADDERRARLQAALRQGEALGGEETP